MNARRAFERWRSTARLIGAMVTLTLLSVVLAPRQVETVASWTDAEVGTVTFSAITVRAPVITGCTAVNALLAASVTFTWTLPSGSTPSDVDVYGATSLLSLLDASILSSVRTTGPVGGVYTTTYSGGLLSNTLGGTVYVGTDITSPSGWTSDLAYITARIPVLIGTGTCTVTNPS